jgi:general secretion pathway protein G
MISRRKPNGFTLIELMIVIMIILILISMAAGRYDRSVQRARETALKTDLRTMRDAIDNFTMDKQAAPQSLDDLVNEKYLRDIPLDPMTRTKDWTPEYGDTILTPQQNGTGLTNVHSASPDISPFEGTAYNTW